VIRDFDLLKQIDAQAILPEDLQPKLKHGTFITFSFSTLDDNIASIFEPGATPPSQRFTALKAAAQNNFLTGVSMMPMLPFITDNGTQLEHMFSSFKEAGAHYLIPATITLFGDGASDSKTLVLRAVAKHYPHLLEKYQRFFEGNNTNMPAYYRNAFYVKMKTLAQQYDMPQFIVK
jgi:DNA repair photolyase